MKISSDYYFYQNDHLGTPQKLTAINGAVVWSAKYSSFGKATVDGSSTITNNLRYPGQYYDQETGLHYNWWRYYDPQCGRYMRADPIGLLGGDENFYVYVWENSLNWTDPYGLQTWSFPSAYRTLHNGWRPPHSNGQNLVNNIGQESEVTRRVIPNDCIRVNVIPKGQVQTEWDIYTAYPSLHQGYQPQGLSIEINSDCLGCTARCLLRVGTGEVGTKIAGAIGKAIAKRLAWETGKQIIPVLGTLSSVKSGVEAIICFVKCN